MSIASQKLVFVFVRLILTSIHLPASIKLNFATASQYWKGSPLSRQLFGGLWEMVRKNLLLTGKPGIGKTTVICKVLKLLPPQVVVDGFFTEEIREGGERIGFQIVTLKGQRAWLALKGLSSPLQVGKYGVDERAIESVIVPSLKSAIAHSDLIVIDEIAKMELSHPQFAEIVWQCLESPKPVLGAIQKSHLPFLDKVRLREDVWLWEVTKGNRNEMPEKIAKVLMQVLQRPEFG